MTCKDCIHFKVCGLKVCGQVIEVGACKEFTDKSIYLKAPCKIGDKVYAHNISHFTNSEQGLKAVWEIIEGVVKDMEYSYMDKRWSIMGTPFGQRIWNKSVFNSLEEAKKELKEKEKRPL